MKTSNKPTPNENTLEAINTQIELQKTKEIQRIVREINQFIEMLPYKEDLLPIGEIFEISGSHLIGIFDLKRGWSLCIRSFEIGGCISVQGKFPQAVECLLHKIPLKKLRKIKPLELYTVISNNKNFKYVPQ